MEDKKERSRKDEKKIDKNEAHFNICLKLPIR